MMETFEEINEAANAVAELLDAAVYVYSGEIDESGFAKLIDALYRPDEQISRKNAILFLTTNGGDAGQAYKIARLFQTTAETFYLCVPTVCKSAGTLIALGANKIYMYEISELGPLDVQVWKQDEIGQTRSGLVTRSAFEGLHEESFKVFEQTLLRVLVSSEFSISFDVASRIASTIAVGVMAPVYAQVNPDSLGNDLRNLSIAKAYGERLAEHGNNVREEAIRQLVEEYPTHEFIIDRFEATKLFKNVGDLSHEMTALVMALGGIIYSVQHPHFISRVDGDFEHYGSPEDDDPDTENDAAGVDDGREAAEQGDHRKGEKRTKEKTNKTL